MYIQPASAMRSPYAVFAALLLAASLLPLGCGPADTGDAQADAALARIDTADLAAHVRTLASDDFEGREPSTPGEEKTVDYLRGAFRELGLEPGNGDRYVQEVPLVQIALEGTPALTVSGGGQTTRLAFGDDFVAWTQRVAPRTALERSELVFVGYGIVAPEYGWDDYAGLDVAGKTVVMLVNDPGFATQDTSRFNGNAMTYYGRWTYKFEEAARQGAAGALLVHETAPAGYGWATVRSSWTGPQFSLASDDGNADRAAVEGWLTREAAANLFARAGQSLDRLGERAARPGFEAVPLGLQATVALTNRIERSTSRNVLAVLPGGARADEYVIYMAHWDHLGRDPTLDGDQIYNGALDNATGTAGLLEVAEAFTALDEPPGRSVLFLAVTAEEQGLLGSTYYATHPTVPLAKTVAALNMDALNILGPMNDVTVIGYGNSALDAYVERAAGEMGRTVRPNAEPEKGFYYRSDHFSFAKQGVPALYADAGIDHVEHGEDWTRRQLDAYVAERYHQPADEFDPAWDLRGAVDDLQLLFTVGYRLAQSDDFPNWNEGTEFKAARDAMMNTADATQ